MTERILPPPCPNCSGKTTLKEMHKLGMKDSFMCFFRCAPCSLDYPLAAAASEIAVAGWNTLAPMRKDV